MAWEIIDLLRVRWDRLPDDASFFFKLRNVSRQLNKQRAMIFMEEELDIQTRFEVAIAFLHEDAYNVAKQGKVSELKKTLKKFETKKAKGNAVRSRVKWKSVGDKCLAEFFKLVWQKNSVLLITTLKDT